MITLLQDITRHINKKETTIATKGEQVTLIADHDNVLIVESKKGYRFSVKKEFTTWQKK